MNQFKTKIWLKEYTDVFKAIAFKEKLYHELIVLWLRKHPEFFWDYEIRIGEYKIILEIVLTDDPSEISKRYNKKSS